MCPLPQLGRGCCDTQGPGWWSLAHTKGGGVHQKRVSIRLSTRPVYISFWRKWLWSPFCRGNMPYVHTAHISRTCASKEISRSVHTICRLSPRGAGSHCARCTPFRLPAVPVRSPTSLSKQARSSSRELLPRSPTCTRGRASPLPPAPPHYPRPRLSPVSADPFRSLILPCVPRFLADSA